MIAKYKCDRCGISYEPSLNIPFFKVCEQVGECEYEDVDLCPECELKLSIFMNYYEEANHDSERT